MSNVNYSFTQDGVVYDFDDIFVPAESFRGPSLLVWGRQNPANTSLGIGSTISPSTPVTTLLGGNNWKYASIGGLGDATVIAAIKTDGTLWVWGNNTHGQSGTNTNVGFNGIITTPVTTIAGGTNWYMVSATRSMLAVKTNGTLWTWGNNDAGNLGLNDIITRSTPTQVFGNATNWKFALINNSSAIGLKTDGTLWTWGSNSSGQLGVNDNISRSTPVTTLLGGNDWKYISSPSAAIKTDGTLWIWGVNSSGLLGVNDTTNRLTPVTTLLGGNNWKSIASGTTTVAIKTDGTLWSWGYNTNGELGVNDNITRSTPVTTILGGTNWKFVPDQSHVSTIGHVSAIKTDGTLWIWGNNTYGQLGVNDNITRSTPVTTLLGKNEWKLCQARSDATVAIKYEPDP